MQLKAEYIGDLKGNQRALGLSYKMLLAPDLDPYVNTSNLSGLPSIARVCELVSMEICMFY